MTLQQPSIPTATYRLQFNREFTFRQAREIVGYLRELGISHCYASPYFQATASSMHGYDICNHNQLNSSIGTREEYDEWIGELHRRGMGQVLDIVPNHMGISECSNEWWMDVLENGPSSIYANYFDIDWNPLKEELENKVLLPILGDQYGRVLERGEFSVEFESGAFFLRHHETKLPLNPRSYPIILNLALENLSHYYKDQDFYLELQSIITALDYLPRRTEETPQRVEERAREKTIVKKRLERLCGDCPQVLQAIEEALRQIKGRVGDPRSFDLLDQLLNAQTYRLSYWRVASEEINYRRFFDINNLAAIRVEVPQVFEDTHRLVFELIGVGAVTGLRIDHVDGLWNPRDYLEQLQRRTAELLHLHDQARPFYIIVEKILMDHERLREDWLIYGTTGYEFANQAAQLLVDSSAEKAITTTYQRFVGKEIRFDELVRETQHVTMTLSLASEVNALAHMLNRLSEKNRWYRDFTLDSLATAVREVIACFPVYRTYLAPGQETTEQDRQIIFRAVAEAKHRNPAIERSVFDFLREMLLMHFPENIDDADKEQHAQFVMKFQQCTGPIMAKGLEDTAFYVYNRLVALNEVGGEPQHFGASPQLFHQQNVERGEKWPHSMLATSTHDTKRSEDVRARIAAISELPGLWRTSLRRWKMINRKYKTQVEERFAPDENEEYLLYQTLLGVWPLRPPDPAGHQIFVQRIQDYMTKAIKEAKVNTSWVQPNDAWDQAVRDFVAAILDRRKNRSFLRVFEPVAERVAQLGAINSLSQTLLKCTVPGMPDFYQGNEIWDLSLVDPDNRRPVDYKLRHQMLQAISKVGAVSELVEGWRDGRIKLFVIHKLLRLRQRAPELFGSGEYKPITVSGECADSCIAFKRQLDDRYIVVAAPRLTARVGFPPLGEAWKDTAIDVGGFDVSGGRDLFTARTVSSSGGKLQMAELLSELPLAVVVSSNLAAD